MITILLLRMKRNWISETKMLVSWNHIRLNAKNKYFKNIISFFSQLSLGSWYINSGKRSWVLFTIRWVTFSWTANTFIMKLKIIMEKVFQRFQWDPRFQVSITEMPKSLATDVEWALLTHHLGECPAFILHDQNVLRDNGSIRYQKTHHLPECELKHYYRAWQFCIS